MPKENIILLSDSYKTSHAVQYPEGTEKVFSYFESRGGRFTRVTFFGLQMLLARLEGAVITKEMIDYAESMIDAHMGKGIFNRKGWEYIVEKHGGKLPLEIKAVPEGLTIPVSNVLMTVENTDPECFWLTNYMETYLSQVWYPCTVATLSREIKKVLKKNLEKTGDVAGLPFKLHDFGFRGVSSTESAGVGGCAHLVNFMGTDTMIALEYARRYYNADMAGFSVPASEHSTMTSWGRDHEVDAMRNMLEKYPTGIVSVVSDSYDIYEACEKLWGTELREQILNREGTLVIRPDSGSPVEVIMKILPILGKKFGTTLTSNGYKVLNPKVRIIQGDGVDYDAIDKILDTMEYYKWSGDNIVFGMGGGLLQKLNRDTQKFAFKCSAVRVRGEWRDVYKQPVDCGFKMSKFGRLILARHQGDWYQTHKSDDVNIPKNILQTVFLNGDIVKKYTFEEVRENAKV